MPQKFLPSPSKKVFIMENITPKKLFPNIGDVLVMPVLFLIMQLVVGVVLGIFGLVPPTLTEGVDPEVYMAEQEQLGRYSALVYPLLMVFSIVAIWFYARMRGGKGAVSIRRSIAGFNPSVILIGVIWLLSSQIILEPLMELMPESESPSVGRGVWAWVTVVAFAPVMEELLCRGLILGISRKRWGVKTSILISALFFGAIHLDVSTIIVAFVAGLILGVIYVRTSSIFSTMIIHAINNVLAFTMVCLGFENTSFRELLGGGVAYYLIYGLAVLIFIAVSVEGYFKVLRRKKVKQE